MALATITGTGINIPCKLAQFPDGVRSSPQMITEQIRAPGVDGELHQQVHQQYAEFPAMFYTSETSLQNAQRTQWLFETMQHEYVNITWSIGTGSRTLKKVHVLQTSARIMSTRSAGVGVSANETFTVIGSVLLRCTEPEDTL